MYFDVFNYPLTRKELFENSALTLSYEIFTSELDGLIENNLLKQDGEFILNSTGTKNDIKKRLAGNAGAEDVMPLAYRYSQKVASFPFVEGVFLSGALSKNYYDEKGDIDFFIVTRPNRLWICRTLLILRYKLLSMQKKKYWCVNYFISSDNLTIPDRNVFTGTELAYLIPTVNYPLYQSFLQKNNWYQKQFPNKPVRAMDKCIDQPRPFLKTFMETLLGGKPGLWLDKILLSFTLRHWQKKYPQLSQADFDLQFRSRKDVCKRHTHGFQNKVLVLWEAKQKAFELAFNTALR